MLGNSPILAVPIKGKPLILYIAVGDNSLGALLAQKNEEEKENALYYLSRTLVGAEFNYSAIEKICLALIFAVKKLRHYCLSHQITLISRADPIKFLMNRPMLSGRLAKWALLLSEFDITYVPARAIKGQAIADFLAAHLIPSSEEMECDLPDDQVMTIERPRLWQMYFDGASRSTGAGAGVIFISPQGDLLPYSFTIVPACTNNEAEYQALIIGLQLALEMRIKAIQIYGDSRLVIGQLTTEYEVRKPELSPFCRQAQSLFDQFHDSSISHIPRQENV